MKNIKYIRKVKQTRNKYTNHKRGRGGRYLHINSHLTIIL